MGAQERSPGKPGDLSYTLGFFVFFVFFFFVFFLAFFGFQKNRWVYFVIFVIPDLFRVYLSSSSRNSSYSAQRVRSHSRLTPITR